VKADLSVSRDLSVGSNAMTVVRRASVVLTGLALVATGALASTPAHASAGPGRASARASAASSAACLVPTGKPTNAEFPTSASIPPVNIMTPEPAANAVQIARARRNEPARSANIPTIGPARRRVNIAAASTMPISCGLRALVSKNLGQNGDATPKAAYNAA